MRILYIVHLSSKYTGSNQSLLNMVVGLKDRGIFPLVVLPQRDDMTLRDELAKSGIETRVLQYFMPIYPKKKSLRDKLLYIPKLLRSKWCNFYAKQKIYQLIKNFKIDLIHTNIGPMLLGYEAANKLNIPHVWHLREFQDLDFNLNTWFNKEKFISKLSSPNNFIIAISDSVYKHFKLKPPACVIYNGIMNASQKQFNHEKENYFLFVGYLIENKGIKVLIDTFGKFAQKYPNYKLLVAGSAPDLKYFKQLNELVDSYGIKNNVKFLGPRDDISTLMSKATALIVPSFNEAFGRITAEAMFNGCLVIGKDAGGTKEIIEKIGVGVLYKSDSNLLETMESVISRGIQSYYDNLQLAVNNAANVFSVETNVEQVYEYYSSHFLKKKYQELIENSQDKIFVPANKL
ncbi:glycosyltransferase family 4 protein [Pontibacter sp. SGAir0037]|uniref:glycosyltransferase family 4 protein n=1 Tax=Pontibacter sp. SGAir0037 TaxID=2571030 RepID=UPI0010CD29CB|nr:glycosyltransferase family 4 protein [Pontibacter sp. SGAir0037]QCR20980.1 hypothetical protein C1N53_00435 [Pontibacter sp. SGAir0037]